MSAARRSAHFRRWRLYRWEHPDWWLLAVAIGAWVILVLGALSPRAAPSGHAHHGGSANGQFEWGSSLAWWIAMVAAMMLPLAMRDARWLAHRSLARRRRRTVVLHVTGFLLVWTGVGAVVATAVSMLGLGAGAAAIVLATGAAWHINPMRRRILRRCGPGRAPAIRGLRADADCVLAGVRTGRLCLVTCGMAMVAMGTTHSIAVMGAAGAIGASERRRAPNPEERAGRPAEAAALALLAVVVALL